MFSRKETYNRHAPDIILENGTLTDVMNSLVRTSGHILQYLTRRGETAQTIRQQDIDRISESAKLIAKQRAAEYRHQAQSHSIEIEKLKKQLSQNFGFSDSHVSKSNPIQVHSEKHNSQIKNIIPIKWRKK